MKKEWSAAEVRLPYFPARDCHVIIKNHLLFAAAACFLLLTCFMHFSLYGLTALVPVAGCMFTAGCLGFSSDGKPAHSLKFKANHYLFFFVTGIIAILIFRNPEGYAELAYDLLPNWVSVVLILKGVLALMVWFISFFVSSSYKKKTLHYISALCVLWMALGLLDGNAAMYVLAAILLLWFYLIDLCMIAETEKTGNERTGWMAGAAELAVCGAAALFVFKPFQEAWVSDPLGMCAAVLKPVPLLYLLLTTLCMSVICAKFHPDETLSNNETAAFFTMFTLLVLLKMMMLLPEVFSPAVLIVYLLASVPFLVSVGDDSALAGLSDEVEIAPWVLHLLISVQAVGAYLLLYSHMWICTVALVFSPYLLMFGTLFKRLNNKRYRWHAYLALIFAAFLALCTDIRVLQLRAVLIDLVTMLLMQGALWIWDDQFTAEQKALSMSKATADRILGSNHSADKHKKLVLLVKSLLTGGYVLFSAVLLRKLM